MVNNSPSGDQGRKDETEGDTAIVNGKQLAVLIPDSVEVEEEELCSICRDPIDLTLKAILTDCMHSFHRDCIDQWLEEGDTCPNCKRRPQEIRFNFRAGMYDHEGVPLEFEEDEEYVDQEDNEENDDDEESEETDDYESEEMEIDEEQEDESVDGEEEEVSEDEEDVEMIPDLLPGVTGGNDQGWIETEVVSGVKIRFTKSLNWSANSVTASIRNELADPVHFVERNDWGFFVDKARIRSEESYELPPLSLFLMEGQVGYFSDHFIRIRNENFTLVHAVASLTCGLVVLVHQP